MRIVDFVSGRGVFAAAICAIAPCMVAAQTACPSGAPAGDSSAPLVVIVAHVHADAVVFEADPDARVTLNGCEPTDEQRRYTSNLPDTIVPGVRYTNVEISAEYRVWLNLECRAPGEAAASLCETLGAAAADTTSSQSRETPADGRRD